MSGNLIPYRKSIAVLNSAGAFGPALPLSADAAASINANAPEQYIFSAKTRELQNIVAQLKIPPSPSGITFCKGQASLAESLFDATAKVKTLTSQVAMHLDKVWREKLFAQIDSIHDPVEWSADDTPVREQSFATFLKTICLIKPARRPGLGLSRVGHLVASWRSGKDELIIEFLPSDRVRWVLTTWLGSEAERFAGKQSVAGVAAALHPHHPEKWFASAG